MERRKRWLMTRMVKALSFHFALSIKLGVEEGRETRERPNEWLTM